MPTRADAAAPPRASDNDALDAAGRGYPRPQFVRGHWTSLNGRWDFALDADAAVDSPAAVNFDKKITVPFAPETPAAGVAKKKGKYLPGFFKRVWYRRTFARPAAPGGHRVILHFGAVDHAAAVWVNGVPAGRHEGGYTPFAFDVTDLLAGDGAQTLVVRADDDPHDLAKPRGKQDWQAEPHGIWYPRTTGIWQTVWLEVVPPTRVESLRWTPSVDRGEVALHAELAGDVPEGARLAVTLTAKGRTLADDVYAVGPNDEVARAIAVHPPGVEDFSTDLLWAPEHPTLIDARVRLLDAAGATLDEVASYTALRSVACDGDRFTLNRRPRYLRLVLDQGYWPDTGLTAPDDAALRRDVELARELGFNGVRKHQKIEDPRYLCWADRLGLLVWAEMPSPYRFTPKAIRRLAAEWAEAIGRDAGHPCIVAWVPFNESWGVPDLPHDAAHRDLVRAIYHLTRSLDPTRPAIGNDGWEAVAGDLIGIHDYAADPQKLFDRYNVPADRLADLLRRERPGHRVLAMLEGQTYAGQPVILSEFGGIAYSREQGDWGYSRAESPEALGERYAALLKAVRAVPLFGGFCYTQLTDTYQEANGLLFMDRSPKVPIEAFRAATRG